MTNPKPAKRPIISADGELAMDSAPLYCNRCGAPNPTDSNFCRKCGHSLLDQEAEMAGVPELRQAASGAKAKPDHAELAKQAQESGSPAAAALVQIFTMLSVGGMGITAFVTGGGENWVAAIPIFVAWFLVEGIRGRKRHLAPASYAVSTILTVTFVAGLVITALVTAGGANWAASIPILIAWFLIEGIRADN